MQLLHQLTIITRISSRMSNFMTLSLLCKKILSLLILPHELFYFDTVCQRVCIMVYNNYMISNFKEWRLQITMDVKKYKELLTEAKRNISDLSSGCQFELNKLPFWNTVDEPTDFGRRFHDDVSNGSIPVVRFFDKKTDNHYLYEKI